MRSRERRFSGDKRTWQIKCSECPAVSKLIGGSKWLPPNVIVKKLLQTGWQVGDNPKHDRCPDCIRRPIKASVATANKALNDAMAPMVTVNGHHRIHFTELAAAAGALDPEHAKELIEILRKQIPPKPPRKPKAEPPPMMGQSDYEAWLAEEERNKT